MSSVLLLSHSPIFSFFFFFFNDTATTEIYTLSLHDALPISPLALFCSTSPAPSGAYPVTSCTGIRPGAAASVPVIVPSGAICASAILARSGPCKARPSPATGSAPVQRAPIRITSPRRTSLSAVISADPGQLQDRPGGQRHRGSSGIRRPAELEVTRRA